MKTVNVTYFKPSGKYYTHETVEIDESLNGYEAIFHELPKRHRIKETQMLVTDSDDGKEPYIVPHLFKAKEESEIEHHNSGQLPPNIGLTANRNSTQAHGRSNEIARI